MESRSAGETVFTILPWVASRSLRRGFSGMNLEVVAEDFDSRTFRVAPDGLAGDHEPNGTSFLKENRPIDPQLNRSPNGKRHGAL